MLAIKMTFEKDYTDILNIVKFMLNERGLNFIISEDIISDTYIKLNKKQYEKNSFLNECKIIIKEYTRDFIYRNVNAEFSKETEKNCLRCKEILPISCFGITRVYRYNGSYTNSYCKKCVREHVSEYRKKRKTDPRIYKLLLETRRRCRAKKRLIMYKGRSMMPKCCMSEIGKKSFPLSANRKGVITAETKNKTGYCVLWNGNRRSKAYHKSFIDVITDQSFFKNLEESVRVHNNFYKSEANVNAAKEIIEVGEVVNN